MVVVFKTSDVIWLPWWQNQMSKCTLMKFVYRSLAGITGHIFKNSNRVVMASNVSKGFSQSLAYSI